MSCSAFIFTGLWVLGLGQAVSNLGYAAAAFTDAGRAGIYAASLCESFTGGMGAAAFMAYLMNICDKAQAATEYALLSAIFALPRFVVGSASGWLTTQIGFGSYFLLTFFLAFPAYAMLPWARATTSATAASRARLSEKWRYNAVWFTPTSRAASTGPTSWACS